MKHVFVVNPAAGKGEGAKSKLPMVQATLLNSGLDYEIHRTLSKGETGEYVKRIAAKGEPVRFYACGGDGTVNDVLCGMIGFPNAELAVIPRGTGNDFVRNFTNQSFFSDIAKQIAGSSVPCDVIKMNDTYCLNMANVGADCDVVVKSIELKEKTGVSGSAAYLKAALQILPQAPSYKMSIQMDGGEEEDRDVLLAAVGNGIFCGGGFKSCPTSSLNDGLMDVCVVKPVPKYKLIPLLLKYRAGKHLVSPAAAPYVDYFQCKSFTLKPKQLVHVSIDGEVNEFKPTHFEIIPGAIKLSIPLGSKML